jgi:two-component system, sensor histidine kinase and response regulator
MAPSLSTVDQLLPSDRSPGRILVVDDQPDNLKVIALEFKHEPFRLMLAHTAQEALELCEQEEFEGILLDVSLPGMDGFEVCRRIRLGSLNARTPVIFLSALRAGEDWITKGLEAGGLDYLVKPHAFPELLAKMRVMVRLSRQERALLAAQRQEALLEVAGGAAHELSQPLASAQILLDQLNLSGNTPTPAQLKLVQECLAEVAKVLHQIQNLHTYVTKPYADGRILDLARSSRNPGEES